MEVAWSSEFEAYESRLDDTLFEHKRARVYIQQIAWETPTKSKS